MSSPQSQDEMNRQTESARLESIWKEITTHLEAENHRIYEEIRNYPRPIPACDVQFNQLLEDRASIYQELDRLKRATREILDAGEPIQFIDKFIESLKHIDDETKQTMRSSLLERLSDLQG